MNSLVRLWRHLTYRTEHSTPDPVGGLQVIGWSFGARTVYDPRVPLYLQARRMRLLRDGCDPIDRALMDPATVELLASATRNIIAQWPAEQWPRASRRAGTRI